MAYHYSNYHQNPDYYHYNLPYNGYSNYDHTTNEPSYIQNYDPQLYPNYYYYQQTPTPSLIGYYYNSPAYDHHQFPANKNTNYHDEPVTTELVLSYSVTESKDEPDLKEYDPHKFHGGYNMSETYGKPLPPSDEICYPPSKTVPAPNLTDFSYDSVPALYGKEVPKPEMKPKPAIEGAVSKVAEEEKGPVSKQEEDNTTSTPPAYGKEADQNAENEAHQMTDDEECSEFEQEEKEEEEECRDDQSEHDKQIVRRQIPPGYGIEALDLCEGIFGGYFPCLWKRNQNMNYDQSCGIEVGEYDCWRGTADYLFGNPNPYGGSNPEKGSYGDPVYSYQRYYPQQSVCEKVDYEGNCSLLSSSRHYY